MAAIDFIDITRTAGPQAQQLGNARDALRQAASTILELYGVMGHMTDGTVFTTLETEMGLTAGKGTIVYNAVQQVAILFGAQNTIDPNIDKIINRMR
jgi:hypothetical protein